MSPKVEIEKKVLSENDKLAAAIRSDLQKRGILSLNMVSSPGSGKTSLLEQTLRALGDEVNIGLIAGDVQTDNDAKRLEDAGGKMVRPIVTGGMCHLDAKLVTNAMNDISMDELDLLIVENVGNLVCPSSYDLGEDMKVVLISVTEGDDKPLKYPGMFRRSSVMVINKIDMLELCDFSIDTVRDNALKINGDLTVFETSCRTGDGLDAWYDWLKQQIAAKKSG